MAELTGAQQYDVTLADADAALLLALLDVVEADAVAARDDFDVSQHGGIDQYAAGNNAGMRRINAVACCALWRVHPSGRHAVVQPTVPHKVRQAIDVGDQVA